MASVRFTVPGRALGKGRPRFSRKSGTAYTPTETRNYEAYVRYLAVEAMKKAELAPFEGPCKLVVRVYCEVPQSWSKKKRAAAETQQIAPGRPDLDNYVKISDAMIGVVFKDDVQIVAIEAAKRFGQTPCMEVEVHAC